MKQENICVKIQSWTDIVTNSSSEIFCISNGSISHIKDFINCIIKNIDVDKTCDDYFKIIEVVNLDSFMWRMWDYDHVKEFIDIIVKKCHISPNTIQNYIQELNINGDRDQNIIIINNLDNYLSKFDTSLLDIVKMFNNNSQDGYLIETNYSLISKTYSDNNMYLKSLLETLENIFNYAESER